MMKVNESELWTRIHRLHFSPTGKIPVIIYCDPGKDDAIMLAQALSCPKLEILGIICSAGNTTVNNTVTNALLLCEYANRKDIKVLRGSNKPLALNDTDAIPLDGQHVYGVGGLGNIFVPKPSMTACEDDPISFASAVIMQSKHPITLISTGGLTDVYRTLQAIIRTNPQACANICAISMMAGVFDISTHANAPLEATNRWAEFNIIYDPIAAKGVFKICHNHNIKIYLSPLDLTHQVRFSAKEISLLQSLTQNKLIRLVSDLLKDIPSWYLERFGRINPSQPAHDLNATMCLIHPELYIGEWTTIKCHNHDNVKPGLIAKNSTKSNPNVFVLNILPENIPKFFELFANDLSSLNDVKPFRLDYVINKLIGLIEKSDTAEKSIRVILRTQEEGVIDTFLDELNIIKVDIETLKDDCIAIQNISEQPDFHATCLASLQGMASRIKSTIKINLINADIKDYSRKKSAIKHFKELYKDLKALVQLLLPKETPPKTFSPETDRLIHQQQQLLSAEKPSTELQRDFDLLLKSIYKYVRTSRYHVPSVFISYARPTEAHQEEQWILAFLETYVKNLNKTGIITYLDLHDSNNGYSATHHMAKIEKCTHVILIGTQSLAEKEMGKLHMIHTELNYCRKAIKDGKPKVIPILLCGDYEISFPIDFLRYTAIEAFREKGYLRHLKDIIQFLFMGTDPSEDYDALWSLFNYKYPKPFSSLLAEKKPVVQTLSSSADYLPTFFNNSAPSAATKQRPLISNVESPTVHFIGRKQDFINISKTFDTNGICILAGPSGVGKSQIARKYAYDNQSKYDVVWWIDPSLTADEFYESLAFELQKHRIALHILEPIYTHSSNPEKIRENIKKVLQNASFKWLIIIDNIASEAAFRQYLPNSQNSNGRILTTTTNQNWQFFQPVQVSTLNVKDSVTLIKKLLPENHSQHNFSQRENDYEKLARELEGVTLVITQACFFIRTSTAISITDYIDLLKTNRETLAEYEKAPLDHKENSYASIKSLIQRLQLNDKTGNAYKLLLYCAYLNARVPLFVAKRIIPNLVVLQNSLDHLKSFSLAELNSNDFILHNLTQWCVIHDYQTKTIAQANERTSLVENLFILLHDLLPKRDDTSTEANQYRLQLIPLYKSLLDNILRLNITTNRLCQLYNDLGIALYRVSRYSDALAMHKAALQIADQGVGDSLQSALIKINIAECYLDMSNINLSIQYYKQALEFFTTCTMSKEIKLQISAAHNGLCIAYDLNVDHNKAFSHGLEAIKIREDLCPDSFDLANSYNNLANLFLQVNPVEALSYYQKALAIWSKPSDTNPNVANGLSNIGFLYFEMREIDKALEYLNMALKIAEKAFSSQHAHLARIQGCLADVYYYINGPKFALKYYNAAKLNSCFYETDHIEQVYIDFKICLCECLLGSQQITKAIAIFESAMKTYAQVPIRLIEMRISLAELHYRLHDYSRAETLFAEVLQIHREKFPDATHKHLIDLMQLGQAQLASGHNDAAQLSFIESAELLDKGLADLMTQVKKTLDAAPQQRTELLL